MYILEGSIFNTLDNESIQVVSDDSGAFMANLIAAAFDAFLVVKLVNEISELPVVEFKYTAILYLFCAFKPVTIKLDQVLTPVVTL